MVVIGKVEGEETSEPAVVGGTSFLVGSFDGKEGGCNINKAARKTSRAEGRRGGLVSQPMDRRPV